ncbi:MAG: alpha/beta hydrolase [Sporichthyaceae bacterium]
METDGPFPYPRDDPELVHALAARCRRASARCSDAADQLTADGQLTAGSWRGTASAACRAELGHAAHLAGRLSVPLHRSALAIARFSEALIRARAAIDRVRAGYEHDLSGGSHDELAGGYHRRYAAILEELQGEARAVRRQLDSLARSVLPDRGVTTGSPADVEALLVRSLPLLALQRSLVSGAAGIPVAGTAAGTVRLWWSLLTGDEQQRIVDTAPASVGNLEGLPAQVRSIANEGVLDDLLAVLQSRCVLDAAARRTLENCLAVRREIDHARQARQPRSRGFVVVQLLVFEPRAFAGDGRAAIAIGNVDSADHVAFLVPGLSSTIRESLPGLVGKAALLGREAERVSSGTTTAAVAWMGYDAPSLLNVAGDGAAETGADLLAADVMAVQASRDVVPHLTVIGNSYGSTTAGIALRDHVTGVDDAVLVGSPGAGVEHVSALHIPAGHVFVGSSSRDPISYVDRFGLDPTHERFGAVRFQAEDVTRNSWRMDLDDHAKYFEPKTESLANIVNIVVGRYAEVGHAAYRHEVPFFPDGINSDPEAHREPTVPTR